MWEFLTHTWAIPNKYRFYIVPNLSLSLNFITVSKNGKDEQNSINLLCFKIFELRWCQFLNELD